MRLTLLALLFFNVAYATGPATKKDSAYLCEEFYTVKKDNIQDIQKILDHDKLNLKFPYYMYLETTQLEDLQAFKNCVDYMMCGKYQESIVDDPANYRMHIWKSMTPDQLNSLIKSCPVKDLAQKLVVRYDNQKGKMVKIKHITPDEKSQKSVKSKGSPAIFHEPSEAVSKAMVDVVNNYLKMGKVNEAHKVILYTWGIHLHGYELSYTGEKNSFAVTNHETKKISYGKDWLSEPCDYIRMIRHEAEHVAQMKRANSCPQHNFDDHKKRERAAHLNDARFMRNVCANTKAGDTVKNFCLKRFRENYMNLH